MKGKQGKVNKITHAKKAIAPSKKDLKKEKDPLIKKSMYNKRAYMNKKLKQGSNQIKK